MASTPEANPDSLPAGPSASPEQVSPADGNGRESVEHPPGTDNGTAGTKETDHRQDREVTP